MRSHKRLHSSVSAGTFISSLLESYDCWDAAESAYFNDFGHNFKTELPNDRLSLIEILEIIDIEGNGYAVNLVRSTTYLPLNVSIGYHWLQDLSHEHWSHLYVSIGDLRAAQYWVAPSHTPFIWEYSFWIPWMIISKGGHWPCAFIYLLQSLQKCKPLFKIRFQARSVSCGVTLLALFVHDTNALAFSVTMPWQCWWTRAGEVCYVNNTQKHHARLSARIINIKVDGEH